MKTIVYRGLIIYCIACVTVISIGMLKMKIREYDGNLSRLLKILFCGFYYVSSELFLRFWMVFDAAVDE